MNRRMFPTGGQYVEALQNPGRCFTDAELQAATIRKNPLGLPQPISGNFSCVFHATSPRSRQYAIKCFTREAPYQMERYAVIHNELEASRFQWATDFAFTTNGIKVGGVAYPILRMDWIDARPLNDWLARNVGNPESVSMLADQFDQIIADMSSVGIAHGDLQHGNLLVQNNGTLRLVDYDGMYFPQLKQLPPNEYGHPNYQSPKRSEDDYGPEIDYFSAWLISLSLRAIAADGRLWDQLNPSHDEYLLLEHSDLRRNETSPRFGLLLTHPDPHVRELAIRIREFLSLPVSAVPRPEPITPDPLSAQHSTYGDNDTARPTSLPSWMISRVEMPYSAKAGDPAPSGGHPGFSVDRHMILYSRITLVAGLAIAGAALITVWLLIAVAVIYIAGSAWAFTRYREDQQARAYAELKRRYSKAKAATQTARNETAPVEKHKKSLEKRLAAITKEFDKRRSACQADHGQKIKKLERLFIPVDRDLGKLQRQKQQEIARELAGIRAVFVSQELASARITAHQIPGIGPKNVMNLNAAGICSAADFNGVVVQAGAGYYSALMFRLSNGRQVRVLGIGAGKGQAIEAWRQQQIAHANARAPKTLPSSDLHAINSAFSARERELNEQRKRIEAELAKDRAPLDKEFFSNLAVIEADRQDAESKLADERQQVAAKLAERQTEIRSCIRTAEDLKAQISVLGKLTFTRFLASAVRG